ncbi:nitrile hydratase subunit beta [soil metagenome]
MNGVHDMGGMQGYGPVQPQTDEPLFHAPWERRALAVTLAMGATGQWNIDMARAARESLPPADYLSIGYYRIWLAALEALMLQRGLVTAAEIADGHAQEAPKPIARVLLAANVDAALAKGTSTERAASTTARFAIGQRVRALNLHPSGHTRLPRYVRGHVGTVVQVHGTHVFADRHALGEESPQWLYAVEFAGTDLWGVASDPLLRVSVDAWEPYLESAEVSPVAAGGA